MDYKYIEQLMERYWNAETSLEEESILRSFFSQENIPAEMEQWRPLFVAGGEEPKLSDDFDTRILTMIGEENQHVQAQEVKLTQRLMPLFKAAAVVAISDYTSFQLDTVDVGTPVQAENIIDKSTDSTSVMLPEQSKN